MNDLDRQIKLLHTEAYFSPLQLKGQQGIRVTHSLLVQNKANVFHESTTAIPSISILLMHCSRRTMQRFLCVVLSERSSDSSMGQAERANVEPLIAVVHLQDIVGLGNKMWREITNVSSC